MSHYGIDIASFQHPNGAAIDYGAAVAHLRELGGGGQPFVIVKATEATGYVNPWFSADVQGFRAAGAAVGGYIFDHGDADPAAEEAAYRKVAGALPQFDDFEDPAGNANYAAHCGQLIAQNAAAVAYYNQSEEAAGYPGQSNDWEANYNGSPGAVRNPNALIHQYDDQGVVPGIPGRVDMDYWRGTDAQFDALFNHGQAPAPSGNVPPAKRNTFTPVATDGQFGPNTIKAQQFVDFNGDTGQCDGVFGPASKRAMQAHLGVAVDGNVGPVTVKALQQRVGANPDGVWGPQTTVALQRALNAGIY